MEPEIKKLTIQSTLSYLIEAGGTGATTTEIAEAHDYPGGHQQRSNRVSQIMKILEDEGGAERAGTEPSHRYRHGPVSRWRVTPAGIARHEIAGRRRERAARCDERIAGNMAARQAALEAARAELAGMIRSGGVRAVTKAYRAAKIAELRAVPCSLSEIGDVFGITRERVRQIELHSQDRTGTAAGG